MAAAAAGAGAGPASDVEPKIEVKLVKTPPLHWEVTIAGFAKKHYLYLDWLQQGKKYQATYQLYPGDREKGAVDRVGEQVTLMSKWFWAYTPEMAVRFLMKMPFKVPRVKVMRIPKKSASLKIQREYADYIASLPDAKGAEIWNRYDPTAYEDRTEDEKVVLRQQSLYSASFAAWAASLDIHKLTNHLAEPLVTHAGNQWALYTETASLDKEMRLQWVTNCELSLQAAKEHIVTVTSVYALLNAAARSNAVSVRTKAPALANRLKASENFWISSSFHANHNDPDDTHTGQYRITLTMIESKRKSDDKKADAAGKADDKKADKKKDKVQKKADKKDQKDRKDDKEKDQKAGGDDKKAGNARKREGGRRTIHLWGKLLVGGANGKDGGDWPVVTFYDVNKQSNSGPFALQEIEDMAQEARDAEHARKAHPTLSLSHSGADDKDV